jgi:hypothetical protein
MGRETKEARKRFSYFRIKKRRRILSIERFFFFSSARFPFKTTQFKMDMCDAFRVFTGCPFFNKYAILIKRLIKFALLHQRFQAMGRK